MRPWAASCQAFGAGTAGTVPASATNLDKFRIVDISAQQFGQQEHGTSMLQGTLHR
jgi:hypothetical protein